ncbi:MAG: hypothetical protein OXL34_08710 [Gemmatimonadota bacterium]|nr:hypothetical protein [Gemmatimonadota bacterium]
MRRRTRFGLAGLIATLALAACGQGQVSIVVELEDEGGGDARLLEDIAVRLLPYDRDQVFDSLTGAAPTPEPEIPADLLAARDEIAAAQRAWTDEVTLVANLREQIDTLNKQLESLNPAMNEYNRIFRQVDPMITEWERREANTETLFARFNELQQANIAQMNEVRDARDLWADQAYRNVGEVIDALTEASGLEEAADTTGVEGAILFDNVAPGQYWIFARYELVYDELYWNIPITVTREEPVVVRLNRANAQVRAIF